MKLSMNDTVSSKMHSLDVVCIISVLVVCLFVPKAHGLKCYECTISQEGCVSAKNMNLTDCSESLFTLNLDSGPVDEDHQPRCLKTVERNESGSYYTRRCAFNYESEICDGTDSTSALVECSLCNKDYCNDSPESLKVSSVYHYLFLCFMFLRRADYFV